MNRRSFDQADQIRLNLQQLDADTAAEPFIDRLFSTAPILPFTIAFIFGIIAAYKIHTIHSVWTLLASIMILNVIFLIFCYKANLNIRFLLALICSCSIIFSVGFVRYYFILNIPPNHISHYFNSERELATLKGKVISNIRTDERKTDISSIPWLNTKSSFYLNTIDIKTANGWQTASGKVRVQVGEPMNHVKRGNTVQIECWLSRFSPPSNPGQFDLSKHMSQRGVRISASVPIKEGVEVLDSSPSLLSKIQTLSYRFTSNALLDESVTDTDVRSLVSALLLGRRHGLNPQTMAAFRDTNLAHFISLSGMHVGILAGSLWVVLRTTGLSKRPRAVLCVILILMYAMVVPPRAPTMRAVFLSCFFFASVLFRRQSSPLNTLALSALVLLFFRPYELFTAGWQLSFMSVLGILLFHKTVRFQLLTRLFYPIIPYLKRFIGLQYCLHKFFDLLAIGISIWITIAPVLLYYFGRVNPLSPLWTILALPFVLVILYAGFIKILLSAILPTAASVFGWLLNLAANCLENIVVILSKVDFVQIVSYRPGLSLVLTIYLLILSFSLLPSHFRNTKKALFALIVLCFLFPGISRYIDIKNRNTLEMTCLSVGHGQCIVLSGPGNEHILFDAGSITNKNIAHKTIFPYLQHQSIFSLDAVYLSHGDLDHINAIADLASYVKFKNIYANQVLLQTAQKPSIEKQLCDSLIQTGLSPASIQDFNGKKDFSVHSLWPNDKILKEPSISENDKSEVMIIEYANRNILFCGDIEKYAQDQLMNLYPNLKIDILILPHHGSTNNLDNRFIEHLKPSVIVASCSQRTVNNAYHPSAESTTKALYTPIDGAVTIKIKADGELSTTSYRNPKNSLGQRPNP